MHVRALLDSPLSILWHAVGCSQHFYPTYVMVQMLSAAPSSSTPGQPKAEGPKLEAPKASQLPKIEAPKLEAPKPPSLPTPPQPNALPQQDGEFAPWSHAISCRGTLHHGFMLSPAEAHCIKPDRQLNHCNGAAMWCWPSVYLLTAVNKH